MTKAKASWSATVKTNKEAWLRVQQMNLRTALRAQGEAILGLARMKAPELTGALKSDGTVKKEGEAIIVSFGDARVPYARLRHYVNHLHPDTRYYLEDAAKEITAKGLGAYLK